jgi:hypothetical protein
MKASVHYTYGSAGLLEGQGNRDLAQGDRMAARLHRCRFEWLKTGPCWRVEKALQETGIDYERAPGPSRPSKRDEIIGDTGQRFYPAIEFEDGTWYREESKEMEKTIRNDKLSERARCGRHGSLAQSAEKRPRMK